MNSYRICAAVFLKAYYYVVLPVFSLLPLSSPAHANSLIYCDACTGSSRCDEMCMAPPAYLPGTGSEYDRMVSLPPQGTCFSYRCNLATVGLERLGDCSTTCNSADHCDKLCISSLYEGLWTTPRLESTYTRIFNYRNIVSCGQWSKCTTCNKNLGGRSCPAPSVGESVSLTSQKTEYKACITITTTIAGITVPTGLECNREVGFTLGKPSVIGLGPAMYFDMAVKLDDLHAEGGAKVNLYFKDKIVGGERASASNGNIETPTAKLYARLKAEKCAGNTARETGIFLNIGTQQYPLSGAFNFTCTDSVTSTLSKGLPDFTKAVDQAKYKWAELNKQFAGLAKAVHYPLCLMQLGDPNKLVQIANSNIGRLPMIGQFQNGLPSFSAWSGIDLSGWDSGKDITIGGVTLQCGAINSSQPILDIYNKLKSIDFSAWRSLFKADNEQFFRLDFASAATSAWEAMLDRLDTIRDLVSDPATLVGNISFDAIADAMKNAYFAEPKIRLCDNGWPHPENFASSIVGDDVAAKLSYLAGSLCKLPDTIDVSSLTVKPYAYYTEQRRYLVGSFANYKERVVSKLRNIAFNAAFNPIIVALDSVNLQTVAQSYATKNPLGVSALKLCSKGWPSPDNFDGYSTWLGTFAGIFCNMGSSLAISIPESDLESYYADKYLTANFTTYQSLLKNKLQNWSLPLCSNNRLPNLGTSINLCNLSIPTATLQNYTGSITMSELPAYLAALRGVMTIPLCQQNSLPDIKQLGLSSTDLCKIPKITDISIGGVTLSSALKVVDIGTYKDKIAGIANTFKRVPLCPNGFPDLKSMPGYPWGMPEDKLPDICSVGFNLTDALKSKGVIVTDGSKNYIPFDKLSVYKNTLLNMVSLRNLFNVRTLSSLLNMLIPKVTEQFVSSDGVEKGYQYLLKNWHGNLPDFNRFPMLSTDNAQCGIEMPSIGLGAEKTLEEYTVPALSMTMPILGVITLTVAAGGTAKALLEYDLGLSLNRITGGATPQAKIGAYAKAELGIGDCTNISLGVCGGVKTEANLPGLAVPTELTVARNQQGITATLQSRITRTAGDIKIYAYYVIAYLVNKIEGRETLWEATYGGNVTLATIAKWSKTQKMSLGLGGCEEPVAWGSGHNFGTALKAQ